MNFLIFRDFFRILCIYFRFNLLKTIKKRLKRGDIFARDPRGCDVARKAMWQSYADPREHLRGAEVTRDIILYRVIVHISIPYSEFKLSLLFATSYKPNLFL